MTNPTPQQCHSCKIEQDEYLFHKIYKPENIVVKIQNIYERNGFIYLWDKLKNEYLTKRKNAMTLDFPCFFVVVPTSTDKRWDKDFLHFKQ